MIVTTTENIAGYELDILGGGTWKYGPLYIALTQVLKETAITSDSFEV